MYLLKLSQYIKALSIELMHWKALAPATLEKNTNSYKNDKCSDFIETMCSHHCQNHPGSSRISLFWPTRSQDISSILEISQASNYFWIYDWLRHSTIRPSNIPPNIIKQWISTDQISWDLTISFTIGWAFPQRIPHVLTLAQNEQGVNSRALDRKCPHAGSRCQRVLCGPR